MATVTLVGLDIGSTSIRAAETSRTKGGQVIRNFGQAPLPGGAVQGGVVQDDKAVTLGLKQLWASTKFHSRHVVMGVTNPQIVVREMDGSIRRRPPSARCGSCRSRRRRTRC